MLIPGPQLALTRTLLLLRRLRLRGGCRWRYGRMFCRCGSSGNGRQRSKLRRLLRLSCSAALSPYQPAGSFRRSLLPSSFWRPYRRSDRAGPDCVARSATSPESGAAGAKVSVWLPLSGCFVFLATRARALKRFLLQPELLQADSPALERPRRFPAGIAPASSTAVDGAEGSVLRGAWPKRIFSRLPGFSLACWLGLSDFLT